MLSVAASRSGETSPIMSGSRSISFRERRRVEPRRWPVGGEPPSPSAERVEARRSTAFDCLRSALDCLRSCSACLRSARLRARMPTKPFTFSSRSCLAASAATKGATAFSRRSRSAAFASSTTCMNDVRPLAFVFRRLCSPAASASREMRRASGGSAPGPSAGASTDAAAIERAAPTAPPRRRPAKLGERRERRRLAASGAAAARENCASTRAAACSPAGHDVRAEAHVRARRPRRRRRR